MLLKKQLTRCAAWCAYQRDGPALEVRQHHSGYCSVVVDNVKFGHAALRINDSLGMGDAQRGWQGNLCGSWRHGVYPLVRYQTMKNAVAYTARVRQLGKRDIGQQRGYNPMRLACNGGFTCKRRGGRCEFFKPARQVYKRFFTEATAHITSVLQFAVVIMVAQQ